MNTSNIQLRMGRSDVVGELMEADQVVYSDKSLTMIAIADITAVSPRQIWHRHRCHIACVDALSYADLSNIYGH